MFFLRLTPFWSIIIDTYFSADFPSGNIIGVIRHKTYFRFLVNGERSQIIAGEQRHYWGTS